MPDEFVDPESRTEAAFFHYMYQGESDGLQKNVNDTAPRNYASNYDIDEERNIIDNDHERNWIAHFLHINKDDLDEEHERPYNRENTASRSICEVKHVLVWIVVRWGTTREVQMLFFFNFFRHFFSFSFFSFFFADSQWGNPSCIIQV